ncbi:MAG: polysaccharide deacetylase family protein [Candidatus Zapsychrus exili]|nr:polysaccharide deacetylase family protein [Candidatus Zapsychrus exili]
MFIGEFRNSFKAFISCAVLIFITSANAFAGEIVYSSAEDVQRIVSFYSKQIDKEIDLLEQKVKEGKNDEVLIRLHELQKISPLSEAPYRHLAKSALAASDQKKFFEVLSLSTKAPDYIATNAIIDQHRDKIFDNETVEEDVFIAPFWQNKKMGMSFCFDDGQVSVYEKAIPIFNEFNFKMTIPINTGLLLGDALNLQNGSWEYWREASRQGHEIANHTKNHQNLTQISADKIEDEINGGFDLIKREIGILPRTFVFPFDAYNSDLIDKVLERHKGLREYNYLYSIYKKIFIPIIGGHKFTSHMAKKFIDFSADNQLWMIAECHAMPHDKIAYTYRPLAESVLRDTLGYLKRNSGKVWVDTFSNIYDYLFESKNTDVSHKKISENKVLIDVKINFDPKEFDHPLTIVVNSGKEPKGVIVSEADNKDVLGVGAHKNHIVFNIKPKTARYIVQWK